MPEEPSLAGPRARFERADALIAELEAATKAFAATRPYRAVQADDPNPLNRRFMVETVQDVPLPIRVRAGEIVHHTRATLDLLVYQLLLREGVTDEKRLRRCAFPIVAVHAPADRKQARDYKNKMERAVAGVPDLARDVSKRCNPGGPGIPASGPIWRRSRSWTTLKSTGYC
jgi:hypothetical protein